MKHALTALALVGLACLTGCVERKLIIRTEPSGAPVFVDQQYVGRTGPHGKLDLPFIYYGTREVRVGPIRQVQRDEEGEIISDSLLYHEQTRAVEVDRPWYQRFPVDFFAEVLWPATIRDYREVDVFALESAAMEEDMTTQERAEQARELRSQAEETLGRASLYRENALRPGAGLQP
jgi:hypothetical protein